MVNSEQEHTKIAFAHAYPRRSQLSRKHLSGDSNSIARDLWQASTSTQWMLLLSAYRDAGGHMSGLRAAEGFPMPGGVCLAPYRPGQNAQSCLATAYDIHLSHIWKGRRLAFRALQDFMQLGTDGLIDWQAGEGDNVEPGKIPAPKTLSDIRHCLYFITILNGILLPDESIDFITLFIFGQITQRQPGRSTEGVWFRPSEEGHSLGAHEPPADDLCLADAPLTAEELRDFFFYNGTRPCPYDPANMVNEAIKPSPY